MDTLPLTIHLQQDKLESPRQRLYLQKLSGVRYLAILQVDETYELTPTHGMPRHVSVEDLSKTDVWEEPH